MDNGTLGIVCTDNILKARQPLIIDVDYDKFAPDVREGAKRILAYDPGPMYEKINNYIDPFTRLQVGLDIENMYPNITPGVCACGCGRELPKRRRRWATDSCNDIPLIIYWLIYGKPFYINFFLNVIAGNERACMLCGEIKKGSKFESDHIIPVSAGGGGCWISNWQRLCIDCHKEKTKIDNVQHKQNIKLALALKTPTLF